MNKKIYERLRQDAKDIRNGNYRTMTVEIREEGPSHTTIHLTPRPEASSVMDKKEAKIRALEEMIYLIEQRLQKGQKFEKSFSEKDETKVRTQLKDMVSGLKSRLDKLSRVTGVFKEQD